MSIKIRWAQLVFALAATIPIQAQAEAKMFEPERVGHWYLSGALGAFNEQTNSQLVNQDAQFGLAISGGYRLTPHVALEIDGLFASQRIDTPSTIPGSALGTADGRANLYSGGIGGLVKLILPLDRVELYVGGGLGVYTTTLLVEGSVLGAHTELTENDTDIGFQAVAGADFFVSRHISVGLEYWVRRCPGCSKWVQDQANPSSNLTNDPRHSPCASLSRNGQGWNGTTGTCRLGLISGPGCSANLPLTVPQGKPSALLRIIKHSPAS